MQYSGKCNGCGACCMLPTGPCKYLQRLGNGLSRCTIYPNHVGTHLGGGYYCNNIMDIPDMFDGCPYNEDKIAFKLQGGQWQQNT
jgi:hypothetical protein